MRFGLALVLLLMLSGCLASPQDDDAGERSDDDDAGGDGLRDGVVFYNEEYQVLPNELLEFDVEVPAGAQDVKLAISVSRPDTPLDEAVVNLSGCGDASVSWSSGANVNVVVSLSKLDGSWRQADLCESADAGVRTVTIDGGATPLAGRVLLRADLPSA